MKKKEDKSHSKVSSLIEMNDYAVEHNESAFFLNLGHIWLVILEIYIDGHILKQLKIRFKT